MRVRNQRALHPLADTHTSFPTSSAGALGLNRFPLSFVNKGTKSRPSFGSRLQPPAARTLSGE